MRNDLILSIALGSFIGLAGTGVAVADNQAPVVVASKAPSSGGKCASGKCGTEKLYEKAEISHNPQDRLVRSRDGKCGISGEGLDTQALEKGVADKCASGVCGQ